MILYFFCCFILLLRSSSDTLFIYIEDTDLDMSTAACTQETDVLIDKVYTYKAPGENKIFEPMYLEGEMIYEFFVGLVTENNCSLKIRVIDPEDRVFKLYKNELTWGKGDEYPQEEFAYFGTAMEGEYRFEFEAKCDLNFNLHIRVLKTINCLYDKLSNDEANNLEFYNINTYKDGDILQRSVRLESDEMYKAYIGRVSGNQEYPKIYADCTLKDPDGVEFIIYTHELLEDVFHINVHIFGTATKGIYTIKLSLTIEDVEWANIGIAIVDDYIITDQIDCNNSDSKEDENPLTGLWDNSTMLDPAMTVATIVGTGVTTLGLVVGFMRHKKSNSLKASRTK